MITQTTENNDMQLQDDNPLVVGYASEQPGNIFYPETEHYRPIILCCNAIVATVDGPAVVVSVHAGIELRLVGVQS